MGYRSKQSNVPCPEMNVFHHYYQVQKLEHEKPDKRGHDLEVNGNDMN